MKIVPYRVLFEVDIDSDARKKGKREYKYSKPTNNMLPVKLSDDGTYYIVPTHDRGDSSGPGPYYQIAFRIEDASPFQLEELSLHLDSSIYRHTSINPETDLYCNPQTKFDLKTNLWYQRSKYVQDNEGNWRIVADSDKAALKVDCITTAGVFKVVVCVNNKPLPSVDVPWIYVLPSAISKTQYLGMLSDLIRLHEDLVHNPNSTVGIGKLTYIENQTNQIAKEIESSKRFLTAIQGAISIPSEQQGKRYTKMHISKVKHFDSRVVRNYIKAGMTGKVMGIEYYEEHDTYENRIIKHVLQQIKRQHQSGMTCPIDPNTDIQTAVDVEFSRITKSKKATEAGFLKKTQRFSWTCYPPSPRGQYHLDVNVNGNCVEMRSHAPLACADKHYIKLKFYASSRREMLFYLENLTDSFSRINDKPAFDIECVITSGRKSYTGLNTVYYLTANHVVSMNGNTYQPDGNDISDARYSQEIGRLLKYNSGYLSVDGGFFIHDDYNRYQLKVSPDSIELQKMRADITANITRTVELSRKTIELWKIEESMIALLSDKWFDGITDIVDVPALKLTPKFQSNVYYADIYQLITERLTKHPILASDFDINAFGVNSTQLVYEYWVFYKILNQLQKCGFVVKNAQKLTTSFQELIQNRKTTEKKSGISIEAVRGDGSSQILIEVGYEKNFSSTKVPGTNRKIQRTPDYFLRIKNGAQSHWYFFDAKYKCFTSQDQSNSKIPYRQEVYDVALSKYIYDLGRIFESEEEYACDEIKGSYVIMANIDDLPSELAENNRLFGDSYSILDTQIQKGNIPITSSIIDNVSGIPAHRYGAIALIQDNDKELVSLIQLIFEYLEANKSDQHANLHYCWNCNSSAEVERIEKETAGSSETRKLIKYYVTCKSCNAFRVDNHCVSCGKSIIKHTMGNYHKWDDSVENSQWGFLCPDCGSPVNGLSRIDLDSLSEDETDFASVSMSKRMDHEYSSFINDELPF